MYSTNLTISNCDISDYYASVIIGSTNSGAMILNNYFHDNANNNSGNVGLSINSESSTISGNLFTRVNNGLIVSAGSGTVTGNTATGNGDGIAVSGSGGPGILVTNNIISGNSYQGLNAYGNVLATNNQIYGNHGNYSAYGLVLQGGATANGNTIHDNDTGVVTDSAFLQNNRIYHNVGAGISESSGTITGNTIYSNSVGISGSGYVTILNNLIYANTSSGVALYGGNGLLDSNTVYQTAGDAFDLSGSANGFTVRDNILVATAGFPESITADSENGFSSDYDDLAAAPNAPLVSWGGQLFNLRSNLYFELGLEQHGQTGDPQFVNPAGPDGILGFGSGSVGAASIIDDGAAGYSETGPWTTVAGGYGNGTHRQPTGNYTGATANYTYTGLTPGDYYQIAATWPAGGDTSSVYSIQSGIQSPLTAVVNQRIPSVGFSDAGGVWQPLGVFRADTATLTVTMIGTYTDMEADAVRLQAVQGDGGADDNFNVQPSSPTVDAGSPLDAFSSEPAPNGGRANLGYTGGTAQATTSPAQLVQVTSPNGLEKLTAGQQVNVTWRSVGTYYPPADYASTVLADSPAVYLRLAEANGTSAADASGHGLTGVVSGDVTLGAAGAPTTSADSAYQFNGANGMVTVPDSAGQRGAQVSLEAWVKPDPTLGNSYYAIAVKSSTPSWTDGYGLGEYGTPGQIDFFINLYYANYVTAAIPLGQWSQIIGTYDGSTIRLYVNGVLASSKAYAAAIVQSTQPLSIGDQGGVHPWKGSIGEVSVYSSALTAIQIQQHYNPRVLGTVTIDLMQGANPTPVQTLTTTAPDNGSYYWTVPGIPGNNYKIRITLNQPAATQDSSNDFFQIVPVGHDYYVNDGIFQVGDVTTAAGDDLNSGKSPDQPLASVAAVLQAYNPGAMDVIHVDSGNYTVYRDLQILPIDSGLTIQGYGQAILNRGNFNTGSYTIDVAGATGATLSGLTITGGVGGINLPQNAGSNFVIVSNSVIFGNQSFGIYVGGGNTDDKVLNNTLYNNTSYGLQVYGARAAASGNQIYGQTYGIDSNYNGAPADEIMLSGNIIRNNNNGIQAVGDVKVSGNTVYGQVSQYGYGIYGIAISIIDNIVYGNYNGIEAVGTGTIVDGNRVFANTIGMILSGNALVQNNKIYSNQTGILGSSYSGLIQNDVIYSNSGTGIYLTGAYASRIINNTLDQPVGNAVRVEGGSNYIQVRGNILFVQNGTPLSVASDSTNGLVNIANVVADPLFVDPAGADGILGYRAGDGVDGGADDNFYVSKNSPAIDAGDSWYSPAVDALGFVRVDDPGTPNTGTNDYFTAVTTGTSVYLQTGGPGGTPQGWHGVNNGYSTHEWNLPLPFSFPFYDSTYTSVTVSSNGFLYFGYANFNDNGVNDTPDFLAWRIMAPFWTNLRTDQPGNDIFVDASQSGQVTIRWSATSTLTGGAVNMAVTLFANGLFHFDYGAGNLNLNPTVGISFGNGYVASYTAGYNATPNLGNAASVQFSLQPGYVDVGAYEFRGSSLDVTPPTVTAVSPTSVTGSIAGQIRIDFSEEPNPIDATATANYQLRDAGPDGIFGTPDDDVYQLSPQFITGTTYVLLNVASGIPLNRVYQLTVVSSTFHNLSGLQLNGGAGAGSNLVETGLLGLPGVQISPTSLSLQAGGTAVAVMITLQSPPTSNVTIVLYPGSQLSVMPNTLTFNLANWNVPQMVNVSALATASGPGSLNFNLTSSDIRYQGFSVAPLPAAIALETTTTLTSSVSPAELDQVVTLSATVAATPGAATPTGNVQFLDGATSLGSATLNASGVATLTTSSFALGAHSLSAVYSGDAHDQGSTSQTLSEMIGKDLVSTTVSSSNNPSSYGQTITFTAHVISSGPLVGPPTGTITFYDALGGDMPAPIFTTLLVNGSATFTSSSLAVGTHGVTIVYGGDVSFAAGASASALSQVVNTALTTTMLLVAPPVSTVGEVVTFTATVNGVSPSGGTVSFFLDGAVPPFGTAAANDTGVATLTTSSLAIGSHSITASYAGDAHNAPSLLSTPVVEQVNASGTIPAVMSVLINNGQIQQSMVTSIQITFNEAVDPVALANAFTLTRVKQANGAAGDNATIGSIHVVVSSDSSGRTVATLTFSGANTEGGSLADGNWTLKVDHNSIVSSGLHATTDYIVSNIKRLYGDFYGTGTVDSTDLGLFGTAFGLTSSNPAFLALCDSDGNGVIDSIDLGRFGSNFGLSI